MAVNTTLSTSSRTRFVTGAFMYFAQGIPQGLIGIAIPAWLASLGLSAGEIASYMAVIALPWAFKLLTGPLMDRYEFLPMGRRRPWVIAAQFGLSMSLLALMLIESPEEQMNLLMLIGVLINCFAATQDVAVDGMSIDLTPVREQGRLNAFMSFGKAIGWATTAAVSGVLVTTFGLKTTAIIAAIASAIPLIFILVVRERAGERVLPWTSGEAKTPPSADNSFGRVFKGINKVLWVRSSVVVMAIMFIDGIVFGFGHALMPIAAVNLFGYSTAQWSQLVAMMGLTGAVVALAAGPMIDRLGAKRMLVLAALLVAAHALLIAQTQNLWQDTFYVRVMLSLWVMMQPVVMVTVIALAMAVCASSLSATQFAIYMSVANLGGVIGAKLYGSIAEQSTYSQSYLLLSVLTVLIIFVAMFHRHHSDAEKADAKKTPRYTIAFGGAEAGVFRSGSIRCPKCRADMEQVDFAGTEIDRCITCSGIWFDAGEIESLQNQDAAAALDTGDTSIGKEHNTIDQYPCPRCSGAMVRVVDSKQTHIWYETCSSCSGSFLDAGELRDLATVSISDFFKGLATPERK